VGSRPHPGKGSARSRHTSGQALVEFALVIPIILMLMMGIVDFGRLMFALVSISNATREASRYASVRGSDLDGENQITDCDGIASIARGTAFLFELNSITVSYERNGTVYATCASPPSAEALQMGDRVVVSTTATIRILTPMISNIVPAFPVWFTSARTIVPGGVQVDATS
jgi:Flp pilus assembly protein TadG